MGNIQELPEFSAYLLDVGDLADPRRRYKLSSDELRAINPNTITAPLFRAEADADLTARIHRSVPILLDEHKGNVGNPWVLTFHSRLWHMAEDSGWFETEAALSDKSEEVSRWTPLFEAKMINQFDHRWSSADRDSANDSHSEGDRANVSYEVRPRYWVPKAEVKSRLDSVSWSRSWLLGWRNITNATNERTFIAGLVPYVAVGNSMPLMFPNVAANLVAAFVANLNSLVVDYVARQKLGGTNFTMNYLRQVPILPPSAYEEADLAFLVSRVLELTYTSHSMTPFARDLGYKGDPFLWDEDRRALLRAELDAWYARAYSLSRDDLRYILDPTDLLGEDYPSETFRVLKKNEINRYGEYRTQRLVLEAWDRQAAGDLAASELDRIPQILPALPPVQVVNYAGLPDGAWMNRALFPDRDADAYGALAAIVHALQGPTPQDIVRLAYRFALAPKKLTPLLDDTNRALWLRLVGREAQPNPDNVAEMVATVDAPFGQALRTLRSQRAIVEDTASGMWTLGTSVAGLDFTAPLESRARFALDAVRLIGMDRLLGSMQPEEIAWLEQRLA